MTTFRRPGRLELLFIGPAFSHTGEPLPLTTHKEAKALLRSLASDAKGRAGLHSVYASAFGKPVNAWDNDKVVFAELARLLTTGDMRVWSVPVPKVPVGACWAPQQSVVEAAEAAAPAAPVVVTPNVLKITSVPLFAPSAETCEIKYSLTRGTTKLGKSVTLKITDKKGATVYSGAHELDGGDKGTFLWDGKSGASYIGPLQSPFKIEGAMADDASVKDKAEVKVEVKEIALKVTAPDDKLMMNDPSAKIEAIAEVKLKKSDGSGVLTKVEVEVTFTFTDPGGDNTPKASSFLYAPGSNLGKAGDAAAVHFEVHPDSSESSADGYKTKAAAKTNVTAAASIGMAKIYFKPSGVGGDDFKLKAAVLDGATTLVSAESNALTVWRAVTFDKIYEMAGETHVSVNGATGTISPVFDPAFVKYTAGAPTAISAAKSVKYIGLWDGAAQKSWATVQAKTAAETPTAAEIAAATYAGADAAQVAARAVAQAAIIAKAQAWANRIDSAFSADMDKWITDAAIPANALVAIKYYHPKFSVAGGDAQTNEWKLGGAATPAWLRVGAFQNGAGGHYYTNLDPDGAWTNWGGLSHGSGRVTVPTGNAAATVKQVVRHEAGHATKSFFKRDVFGPSLDHSVSQAGIMYYTTDGGTTFTEREKKILRGITP